MRRYVSSLFLFLAVLAFYSSAEAWEFFNTAQKTTAVTFDSNNLAKSCNVEFESLKDDEQKQCFSFLKSVVNYYGAFNPQIDKDYTAKGIAIPRTNRGQVFNTGTITNTDAGAFSMPPVPNSPGVKDMPPVPNITGAEIDGAAFSMPPVPN